MIEADIVALKWQEFREWVFLGTDFNPPSIKATAMHLMSVCLGMSKEVIKAVLQDNAGTCSDGPTYIPRFGPTSGALLGAASFSVNVDCANPETKESYNKAFQKLVDLQPDVFLAGDEFYSQSRLSEMQTIFRPYMVRAFEMARGDYLPTLARAWPPLPLA
jgi:hypothetical protein